MGDDLRVRALASLEGWEAVYRHKGKEVRFPVVAVAAVEGSEELHCVVMSDAGPYVDTTDDERFEFQAYRREQSG